eukprot:TRINITY_DN7901_c0_g1_i1.p1 TRINITY_DN7901_c0_g1~~TRINITY_DN7901_c0_g1_i1.p1  ORF type:complete len:237 (+),score=48.08 TRINITY_DN7901_c0_g1_i1:92-802(+)
MGSGASSHVKEINDASVEQIKDFVSSLPEADRKKLADACSSAENASTACPELLELSKELAESGHCTELCNVIECHCSFMHPRATEAAEDEEKPPFTAADVTKLLDEALRRLNPAEADIFELLLDFIRNAQFDLAKHLHESRNVDLSKRPADTEPPLFQAVRSDCNKKTIVWLVDTCRQKVTEVYDGQSVFGYACECMAGDMPNWFYSKYPESAKAEGVSKEAKERSKKIMSEVTGS